MRRYVWLSFGVVIVLALTAGGVAAGGGAQVAFSPQNTITSVGETVVVDVTVATADADSSLAGYDLTLSFDPAVVRLNSFNDSGLVTNGELIVICVTGEIDNVGGAVSASCAAIPLFGAPGVSAPAAVPLLHASFVALAPGESELMLSGTLSNLDGESMLTTFEAGTITVGGAPVAVATPEAPLDASELPATGYGNGAGQPISRVLLISISSVAAVLVGSGGFYLLSLRRRWSTVLVQKHW